jgi:hypothetical protein
MNDGTNKKMYTCIDQCVELFIEKYYDDSFVVQNMDKMYAEYKLSTRKPFKSIK